VFFLERAATAGVHAKIAGNAASVTDRGLVIAGTFNGDISLRAALAHQALVAEPVIALFVFL
jgi:hypothetical protein